MIDVEFGSVFSLLILVFLNFSYAYDDDFTVKIPTGTLQCFGQFFKSGLSVEISYQVRFSP